MKQIILDTDIGPDCDDAGALAILNLLADQGLCRILGVGHCTSNPYGAGTVDAINRYYGRADVEIGTYYGKGFLVEENCMSYNKYITEHFPNRYQKEAPEEVVSMYRRILAAQDDKSVEFVAIGPLNNLSNLLNSQGDAFSPLDGRSLVEQKVSKLTIMGGIFRGSSEMVSNRVEEFAERKIEEMTEWNIGCDISAARNVAEHWKTPKAYIGLEAGLIVTGTTLKDHLPENHPVRLAYRLYNKNKEEGRYSWDLLTVEHAVAENSTHYKKSQAGTVQFDEKGRTIWTPDENGMDYFVELAESEEKIVEEINGLLCTIPAGGFHENGMIPR